MNLSDYQQVRLVLSDYRAHGAKSYRKKQFQRACSILDEILAYEGLNEISKLGRRQIIGYWRRHEHESQKTRIEKFRILKILFLRLGKNEPPKPKLICQKQKKN